MIAHLLTAQYRTSQGLKVYKSRFPLQDLEASAAEHEKTCWCLFRLGITSAKEGSKPFIRESFGRFSTDLKQTDSASLGWNDFMLMDTFTDEAAGYLRVGT
jgi:hypothetical protein